MRPRVRRVHAMQANGTLRRMSELATVCLPHAWQGSPFNGAQPPKPERGHPAGPALLHRHELHNVTIAVRAYSHHSLAAMTCSSRIATQETDPLLLLVLGVDAAPPFPDREARGVAPLPPPTVLQPRAPDPRGEAQQLNRSVCFGQRAKGIIEQQCTCSPACKR